MITPTETETPPACGTCESTGPDGTDASGVERNLVHRRLIRCTTCGTVHCSSPCFGRHREKPLPPPRLRPLARARAWWNAGRIR